MAERDACHEKVSGVQQALAALHHAGHVDALTMPTFCPGWNSVPRWRTIMLPGWQLCPPYSLMPSIFGNEPPRAADPSQRLETLVRLLIRKGLLTEAEWLEALRSG